MVGAWHATPLQVQLPGDFQEVGRGIGFEVVTFAGDGVIEGEGAGVEHGPTEAADDGLGLGRVAVEAIEPGAIESAVELIADDGPLSVREMNADLMRAAGFEFQIEAGGE
jgi:hypothetical protein